MANSIITTRNAKKYCGLHFTVNHTGKMEGIESISTSCLCNRFCRAYALDSEKVCYHCFAEAQMNHYPKMQPCLEENTRLLTSSIIDTDLLPLTPSKYFRFEAFGDLQNAIQVVNYFNLCKKNPTTKFALWTKNPAFISQALEMGEKKPKNLSIVVSSHYLNTVADYSKYTFIDHVFTVYTKEYIENNSVSVNCGARSCLACHRCYDSKEFYINEKLK